MIYSSPMLLTGVNCMAQTTGALPNAMAIHGVTPCFRKETPAPLKAVKPVHSVDCVVFVDLTQECHEENQPGNPTLLFFRLCDFDQLHPVSPDITLS